MRSPSNDIANTRRSITSNSLLCACHVGATVKQFSKSGNKQSITWTSAGWLWLQVVDLIQLESPKAETAMDNSQQQTLMKARLTQTLLGLGFYCPREHGPSSNISIFQTFETQNASDQGSLVVTDLNLVINLHLKTRLFQWYIRQMET